MQIRSWIAAYADGVTRSWPLLAASVFAAPLIALLGPSDRYREIAFTIFGLWILFYTVILFHAVWRGLPIMGRGGDAARYTLLDAIFRGIMQGLTVASIATIVLKAPGDFSALGFAICVVCMTAGEVYGHHLSARRSGSKSDENSPVKPT
jgi:hypothetical protein